jgi:thiol-disulfide isomerase/thioredoxin
LPRLKSVLKIYRIPEKSALEYITMRRFVFFIYVTMTFSAFVVLTATKDIFPQSRKAPNFAVHSVSGKRFVFYNILKNLPPRGIVIVNFTSVYCKPCRREIPELLSISRKGGRAVRLVCIYAESGKPVSENARELGVLEAYVDPFGSIRSKFDVKKIPVTILIDKSRSILGRFEGYTDGNIKSIKRIVIGR